jgi:DNA-binding SARP family transcriptional activator
MPPGALGTVRTYVYKLRQALGYEALESSSAGYALAAGAARTDLDDFCSWPIRPAHCAPAAHWPQPPSG